MVLTYSSTLKSSLHFDIKMRERKEEVAVTHLRLHTFYSEYIRVMEEPEFIIYFNSI